MRAGSTKRCRCSRVQACEAGPAGGGRTWYKSETTRCPIVGPGRLPQHVALLQGSRWHQKLCQKNLPGNSPVRSTRRCPDRQRLPQEQAASTGAVAAPHRPGSIHSISSGSRSSCSCNPCCAVHRQSCGCPPAGGEAAGWARRVLAARAGLRQPREGAPDARPVCRAPEASCRRAAPAAALLPKPWPAPSCVWRPHGLAGPLQRARTPLAILGRKALGLRSRMASTAACRVDSCSRLLLQLTQLQPSQYLPDAKHSQ